MNFIFQINTMKLWSKSDVLYITKILIKKEIDTFKNLHYINII